MTALELDRITHRYPGTERPALSEVSVAVPAGRMLAVVGPSGSGKSTLLRAAAGLVRPTSGAVHLAGRDVTDLPVERRDVTVMFQEPTLFDHLDVAGNVAFAPRLAGARRREARRLARRYLDLVRLPGLQDRPVSALSGGQAQRVALARALAAERSVLLLDEPFSALDSELRRAMHDLVGEVRAALDPTLVLVTHDLDEAALADRVLVVIDGVAHQHAPAAAVYTRPASLAVARMLGGFTEVPGIVRRGIHHSDWGRMPVDLFGEGPAVLLLRREDLRLTSQATPGTVGITARVTHRRVRGRRVVATLRAPAGTTIEVELPLGRDVRVGQETVVQAGPGPAWALPATAAETVPAPGPDPDPAAETPGAVFTERSADPRGPVAQR
ncbi:ABC transporter ATP-binding protein [Serinibacter salmoneus]|uniref:Putative spermidine/putrescine transport system ATP-binding protein/thiamine transport system ATP-binding protein n=1 Tax=Serinibacter salmoneus TaxID=556530 RepID=A0A2A9CZM9_9MICO|nr:ATP-binding cassette domain-containing protein [Serinibacter salmoneus]PFG19152.1 putative spermidine/putrescine transport system ATP-binding protein/thiamine transport system ATP-binding protein [Serinibacter salmoneus]